MLVTLDVVAAGDRRGARALERELHARIAAGGTPIAVMRTLRGERVHAPWDGPAPASVRGDLSRRDGWGIPVDRRRLLAVAAWPDEAAVERFRAETAWPAGAEHWRLLLRPLRSYGAVHGSDPLGGISETRGTQDEPGVVVTWANLDWRIAREFIAMQRHVVALQQASPGTLASFGTFQPTLRRFHGMTISCWARLADALDFAYRQRLHREAIDWYEKVIERDPALDEAWFGRFALVRSEGTLAGRDPFAAMRDATPPLSPSGAGAPG